MTVNPIARLFIALVAAFALPILTWFVWYRLAGYSELTLTIAQLAILVAAVALVFGLRLGPKRLGLSWQQVGRAALPCWAYSLTASSCWLRWDST